MNVRTRNVPRIVITGLGVAVALCAAAIGAADPSVALNMQGTWQTPNGKSGTWRMELYAPSTAVFREGAEFGEWESLEGVLSMDNGPGLNQEAVSAWAVPGHVGFRVRKTGWEQVVFSTDITGSKVQGKFQTPDGQNGTLNGWWIGVRNGGSIADTAPTAADAAPTAAQ